MLRHLDVLMMTVATVVGIAYFSMEFVLQPQASLKPNVATAHTESWSFGRRRHRETRFITPDQHGLLTGLATVAGGALISAVLLRGSRRRPGWS